MRRTGRRDGRPYRASLLGALALMLLAASSGGPAAVAENREGTVSDPSATVAIEPWQLLKVPSQDVPPPDAPWRPAVLPGPSPWWGAEGAGVVWYRTMLLTGQDALEEDLGLWLERVHDRVEVFLDGRRLRSLAPEDDNAALGVRVLRLPRDRLTPGAANELVLRLSSSLHTAGLDHSVPRVGGYAKLLEARARRDMVVVVFAVFFAMIGVNHLFLYLMHAAIRGNLAFAFFAAVSSVYVLTLAPTMTAPWISAATNWKLNAALLPLTALLLTWFLFEYFGGAIGRGTGALLVTLALLAPVPPLLPRLIDPWFTLAVVVAITVVALPVARLLGRAVLRRRPYALTVAAGVGTLTLGGGFDLGSSVGMWQPPTVAVAGQVFPLAFAPLYLLMGATVAHGYWRHYVGATVDRLTGLNQRHHFMQRLAEECARARRAGEVLVAVMIDVDGFKQVNDRLGHGAGDRALVAVAGAVRAALRPFDLVGRFGGDELCATLTLPHAPEIEPVLERVRERVAAMRIAHGKEDLRLTISLGAAVCDSCVAGRETELLEVADQALYQAKREGGNRVVVLSFASDGARAGRACA